VKSIKTNYRNGSVKIKLTENQNDILDEILDYHYRKGDDENNPTMEKCNDFYSTTWEFGREKKVYRKKDFYFPDEFKYTYTESGYYWVEFKNRDSLKGAIQMVENEIICHNISSNIWNSRVANLLLNRLSK
tara:strand:- start:126 stop:518 length:393 start_codon:yes stop_codon:yes gene_type:complete